MAPARTAYVLRHLDELLAVLDLPPGARLLELGCGMGRFSLLLAERGYRVTAVDLSPELLRVLDAEARARPEAAGRLETVCCDAAQVDHHVGGRFDGVVGFFFLHHLHDLAPTFAAIARLLAAGGRVAFCEPNAFNPLFYLQILLTPGMTWAGDRGVAGMRPDRLRNALRATGFDVGPIRRYGLFPPGVVNRNPGRRLESWLERRRLPAFATGFQVFRGDRAGG